MEKKSAHFLNSIADFNVEFNFKIFQFTTMIFLKGSMKFVYKITGWR